MAYSENDNSTQLEGGGQTSADNTGQNNASSTMDAGPGNGSSGSGQTLGPAPATGGSGEAGGGVAAGGDPATGGGNPPPAGSGNPSPGAGDPVSAGSPGDGGQEPGSSPIPHGQVGPPASPSPPLGHGLVDGDGLGLGNILNVNALDGTGNHSVTADAGAPGGSPLAALGALTNADDSSPLSVVAGNGPNIADASLLSGSTVLQNVAGPLDGAFGSGNGSAVDGHAGNAGDAPLVSTGILTEATSGSPINVDAVHGASLADAGALGSAGNSVAMLNANGGETGLGSLANLAAFDNSSDHVVAADGGAAGGSPLAIAGILTDPDTSTPINALVGNGQNVADASLLSNSPLFQNVAGPLGGVLGSPNDSVVSADAGPSHGSPLAVAGVLTNPTSDAPVGADVLSGANAVTANVLDHGALHFANLGGAGTDSLNGGVPSLPIVGNAPSIAAGETNESNSLIDVGHDGSLVQVHNDHSSLIGLDHAAVI